jgi:hypothetical protein
VFIYVGESPTPSDEIKLAGPLIFRSGFESLIGIFYRGLLLGLNDQAQMP